MLELVVLGAATTGAGALVEVTGGGAECVVTGAGAACVVAGAEVVLMGTEVLAGAALWLTAGLGL